MEKLLLYRLLHSFDWFKTRNPFVDYQRLASLREGAKIHYAHTAKVRSTQFHFLLIAG